MHGDKYDYSEVDYVNNKKLVKIICPIHGEFWQTPDKHINCAQGCPKCSGQAMDTDLFIDKSKLIHGDRYDYSKVNYVHHDKDVCIICNFHGEFWQSPTNHLSGKGCPVCGRYFASDNRRKSKEDFVFQSNIVHGNFY